jgi:hypothetical protein
MRDLITAASRGRTLSAALFVIGLLTGSWSDRDGRSAPAYAGPYRVVAADFHVHAFFGDGALPPWELRAEARRRGLDAVAITNHNQQIAVRIDRWLSGSRSDPLVLAGEEITSRHYHLIAIGISHTVGWNQSAADAIAAVHAQGGAAIAAHPIRMFWRGYDSTAAATLDGAEIAHPLINGSEEGRRQLEEFFRTVRAQNPDLAPIGSTDFHLRAPIGFCRTYVFARELTEQGIVEAVRSGRTVAYDSKGNAHGDPALVAIAERERAAHPVAGPSRLETFSVAAALLGLAGLFAGPNRSQQLPPQA